VGNEEIKTDREIRRERWLRLLLEIALPVGGLLLIATMPAHICESVARVAIVIASANCGAVLGAGAWRRRFQEPQGKLIDDVLSQNRELIDEIVRLRRQLAMREQAGRPPTQSGR
jgi:hypothetical protein